MLTIKYFFTVISVWLMTSTFLYNITGKSEGFWFIMLNISILSMFGIFLYAFIGAVGNKFLKKETIKPLNE
jgi:bacteriorhodopsin